MQATNRNGQSCPIASARQTVGSSAPENTSPSLETIQNDIARNLGYQPSALPTHLSTKETATVLRVGVETLAQWRSSGRHNLPYQKTGRYVFYSTRGIAQFIQSRTYSSTSQNGGAA